MAAFISVPRDLSKVKTKVFMNLTKRQLICFGAGALIGVPLFFVLKSTGNISFAAMGMIVVMMPMFFLAMYEKDGLSLEKILWNIINVKFLKPSIRRYEVENLYEMQEKQSVPKGKKGGNRRAKKKKQ